MIRRILKHLNEVYGYERKYGFKEDEVVLTQETDRYIEIENGDCINIQGYSSRGRCHSNQMSSYNWRYTMMVAFRFCQNTQNLFFIMVLLISASLAEESIPTAYTQSETHFTLAIPLFLNMLITIVDEVYYFYHQAKYDNQINNDQTCRKLVRVKNQNFRNAKHIDLLETATWGSLKIGDVVVLSKDEYCPADILILDMWEQKCLVNTACIDDCTDDKLKYSPLLTTISKTSSIKGNLSEYRRILTGRIDLKKTETLGSFYGFVSLKKDPISEKFNENNIISKFSQISYSDWIVGIVILAGSETFSLRQSSVYGKQENRAKPSHFKRKWNVQSAISIMMVLFFTLLVTIIRISMSAYKQLKFDGQMIPIAIDFIFSFPAYFSFINQLSFSILQIFGNSQMNLTIPSQSSERLGYKLNTLQSFSELSLNTHIIFNSLRIRNQRVGEITTVCLRDRYFRLRTEPAYFEPHHHQYRPSEDLLKSVNNTNQNNYPSSQNVFGGMRRQPKQSGGLKESVVTFDPQTFLVNPSFNSMKISPEKRLLKKITELDSKTLINEEDSKRIGGDAKTFEPQISISEFVVNRDPVVSIGEGAIATLISPRYEDSVVGLQKNHQLAQSVEFSNEHLANNNNNGDNNNDNSSNFGQRFGLRNSVKQNTSQSQLNSEARLFSKHVPSPPNEVDEGYQNDIQSDSSMNMSTRRGLTPAKSAKQYFNQQNSNNQSQVSYMKSSFKQQQSNGEKNGGNTSIWKQKLQLKLGIQRAQSNSDSNSPKSINESHSPKWKDLAPRSLERCLASQASQTKISENPPDDFNCNGFYTNNEMKPTALATTEVKFMSLPNNQFEDDYDSLGNSEILKVDHESAQVSANFPTLNLFARENSENLLTGVTMKNFLNQKGVCNLLESTHTGQAAKKKLEEDYYEIKFGSDSETDSEILSEDEEEDNEQKIENNIQILHNQQVEQKSNQLGQGKSADNDSDEKNKEGTTENSTEMNFYYSENKSENKEDQEQEKYQQSETSIQRNNNENIISSKKEIQKQESQNLIKFRQNTSSDEHFQTETVIERLIQTNMISQQHIEETAAPPQITKVTSFISETKLGVDSSMSKLGNSADQSGMSLQVPTQGNSRTNQHSSKQEQQNIRVIESDDHSDTQQIHLSMSTIVPSMTQLRVTDSLNTIALSPGLFNGELKTKHYFENQGGFRKAVQDKNLQSKELLFAMSICHESKSKGDRDRVFMQVQHVHLEQDTETIIDFASSQDVVFECACYIQEQLFYIVSSEKKQREKVQVLNRYTLGQRFVMIVQRENGDTTLYIREGISSSIPGANYQVPNYLSNSVSGDKKIKFESLLAHMKAQGERIIFYSKKSLNETQVLDFQNLIRLETANKDVEKLYDQFLQEQSEDASNRFEILGFIGIEEVSDFETKEMIKELTDYGQKVWVLTSDSQERTLESCYAHKILNSEGNAANILDFSSANFDELLYKTRNHLQVLKDIWTLDEVESPDQGPPIDFSSMKRNGTLASVKQTVDNNHSSNNNNNNNMNTSTKFLSKKNTQQYARRQSTLPLKKYKSFIPTQTTNEISQGGGIPAPFSNTQQDSNTLLTNTLQFGSSPDELPSDNYSIIISGESLNTIRNDEYLWNHFCLLIFFAQSLIGYRLTHEQKAFLGQTITEKFKKQNQRVVNIVSSLSDIERLTYQQLSVFVGKQKEKKAQLSEIFLAQQSQIITSNSVVFLKLIFRDSKLMQELIEESMYLALHRSYLLAVSIIVWNLQLCAVNVSLVQPYESIFFHGFQYMVTFFYYILRKREKFLQDRSLSSSKHDERSLADQRNFYSLRDLRSKDMKQYLPIFNLKIIGSSILDSGLIYLFFQNSYDLQNGSDLDIQSTRLLLQWGIHLLSFCRVFDIHFMKIDSSLVFYIVISACVSILSIISQNQQESLVLFKHLFQNAYFINVFLFLLSVLIKNILESLFFSTQPISLIGLRKYLLEVEKLSRRLSPNKKESVEKQGESQPASKSSGADAINSSLNFIGNNNAFNQSGSSLNQLVNKNAYINPKLIIRTIFKDKEMDIILSSMLQDDVNLSQTSMYKFFLKFQIKEIEQMFEKSWALLIAHSNRVFYVIHFIAFDIGFEILVLASVTNQFSSSDGSYVMSLCLEDHLNQFYQAALSNLLHTRLKWCYMLRLLALVFGFLITIYYFKEPYY